MTFLKAVLVMFVIFFGIPSLIIDFKHRKKSEYHPGSEWAYYSKLSKDGSTEGRFMMFTTYIGILFIVAVVAYLVYRLFTT